jgi:hypothetical protein
LDGGGSAGGADEDPEGVSSRKSMSYFVWRRRLDGLFLSPDMRVLGVRDRRKSKKLEAEGSLEKQMRCDESVEVCSIGGEEKMQIQR